METTTSKQGETSQLGEKPQRKNPIQLENPPFYKGLFKKIGELYNHIKDDMNGQGNTPYSSKNIQSFSFKPLPEDVSIEIYLDKVVVKEVGDIEKPLAEVKTPQSTIESIRILKVNNGVTIEFSLI